MARQKQWTDEDREAALGWIDRKAKTGVVFRGQDESTEAMVARLTAITELADFAEAVQTALTQAAWKRLLGALRQRKHSADDEGQDDEQGAQRDDDAGACQSCARLKAQVDSLHQQLASAINASQAKATEDDEHIEDLPGRIDWLEEVLDGHGLLDEDREPIVVQVEADAGAQDDDGHQAEDHHQVQAETLGAHQVAALALARSYMAAGKTLDEAARAASGKLRNTLNCHLGEGGHIAVAPVHRLLTASEGQSIKPASAAVRDEVILLLVKAGEKYKPIGRALGVSDGTVRNVIKRQQHQAEAA